MKKSIALLVLISALLFVIPTGEALADGNETLGPPSIPIASGTGIVAAGTGLITPPGTINLNVPLGASIKQALLYWEQLTEEGLGIPSDTIEVDGVSITGTLIGISGSSDRLVYRADITGLVNPGPNSFEVVGLASPPTRNDGAGILVIIDDGSGASQIELRDGSDFAWAPAPSPLDTTVPQTFIFDPAPIERVATLDMFFSSVSGTASGGGFRPSAIEITIDGSTSVFDNLLDSNDGDEWDTVNLDIPIPAGATSLTVQALSVDNDPPDTGPGGQPEGSEASFVWIAAGLSVPPPEGCTPGYWKQDQHFDSWEGYRPSQLFSAEEVFDCFITIKWSKKGKPQEVTNPTLLRALQAKGGGESALARHAVAALLNAANPDISYPKTEAQIKTMVCNALSGGDIEGTKNTLAGWNEEFCPLDLDDETPPSVEHTNTNTGPLRSYDITCQDKKSGLAEINVTGSRNFKVDIPPFTAGTNDPTIVTATNINQSEKSFVDLEVIDVAGNVTYYDPEDNPASEEQKSSGGGGGGGCFIATAADG